MAYSISATTTSDEALLDALRAKAREKGMPVSAAVRDAFGVWLYGSKRAWKEARATDGDR